MALTTTSCARRGRFGEDQPGRAFASRRGYTYARALSAVTQSTLPKLCRRGLRILAITTKHIYFHGQQERFRVRYDKIVSFEPYENGLGYMRDLARAKPETFETPGNDGWFLYNLVTNLAQL